MRHKDNSHVKAILRSFINLTSEHYLHAVLNVFVWRRATPNPKDFPKVTDATQMSLELSNSSPNGPTDARWLVNAPPKVVLFPAFVTNPSSSTRE